MQRTFLNGPSHATFSLIFGLYKQIKTFLRQMYVNKCPSSSCCWDSNSQPFIYNSHPLTTKPALPTNDATYTRECTKAGKARLFHQEVTYKHL